MSRRRGEVDDWHLASLFVAHVSAEGAVSATEMLAEIIEHLKLAGEVAEKVIMDGGGDVEVSAAVFDRECRNSCDNSLRR